MMFTKLSAIILKDTIIRFEGRSELLFFLILPIIFTLILGGGIPAAGAPADSRIMIPVADEDNSVAAEGLLSVLAASETFRPESMTRDEAEKLLKENDVAAFLIIPAGFGTGLAAESVAGGGGTELILRVSPNSNIGVAAEQEVQRAVAVVARPQLVARQATQAVGRVRPFQDEAARATYFEAALAEAQVTGTAMPPMVSLTVAGGGSTYDQRAQSSAGQLITWVFIPLLGASGLFAYERLMGTMRRLMTTPTRKSTYLFGVISGQYLTALVQMAILVAFGILVMKVPWGQAPAALAIILVSFGLAGVALGTMLGTFVKTDSQAGNLSIMIGMSMALLGGCWWPMELFPPALQQAVKVLPTTWAMSALTDITMRGQGLVDILPEAAVLLGFAAVFFVIGLWRFRYE
jgi:ABC-2 type transport system permease protein